MPPKKRTQKQAAAAGLPLSAAKPGDYRKLLNRMYEPLLLLFSLDPIRGAHTTAHVPDDAALSARRQFRDDLAFLCEYDKGGDSCTALAVQDLEHGLVYWVAANTDPGRKIAPFLEKLLARLAALLRGGGPVDPQQAADELTAMCIAYCLPKLKKLCSLLHIAIAKCEDRLRRGVFTDSDRSLAGWLQQFKFKDRLINGSPASTDAIAAATALCRLAYGQRMSAEMRQLRTLASADDRLGPGPPVPEMSFFSNAHHYIGRLAHHVRVPARLVQGLADLEDLLLNPFCVKAVPVASCAPAPPLAPSALLAPAADGQPSSSTLLDGVARRLSKSHDTELLAELRSGLAELDRQYGLEGRIRAVYDLHAEKQPRVHAEVQVLEHFHANRLAWAGGGDRYIGCSKPACYCCHLYFRHHPLQPVLPDSHNKQYLRWGPPRLAGGAQDPGYVGQRDLLNLFVADVRKDAVAQIRARRGRRAWQADTVTGITQTASVVRGADDGAGDDTGSVNGTGEVTDDDAEASSESSGSFGGSKGSGGAEGSASPGSPESSESSGDEVVLHPRRTGHASYILSDSGADSDSDGGGVCL